MKSPSAQPKRRSAFGSTRQYHLHICRSPKLTMKRWFSLPLLAVLCLLVQANGAAQDASAPSPAPRDPHIYEDAAMRFRAPDTFVGAGQRQIPLEQLGQTMQPVAQWVTTPGKGNQWAMVLLQEAYNEPLDHWETSFENEMRQQVDQIFISVKEHYTMKNGMPAYLIGLSFGEGFNSRKQFALIWADGARGNALTITGHVGELGPDDAKKAFADISAVLYPVGRE